MKAVSFRTLALVALASLAMATSSSAITILQFQQVRNQDSVMATAAGGITTLTTDSLAVPGSIPVFISILGNDDLNPPILANETFLNVVSTGTATTAAGEVVQTFSGGIRFTAAGGPGAGTVLLLAQFVDATFSGLGGSGALKSSAPPKSVTFSSQDPDVQALIDANPARNFSVSFSGISPPLSIVGGTIASFTARNTGTFDVTPVPEPSGIAMAGTAMLVSLGCFGWRRRQSSRA